MGVTLGRWFYWFYRMQAICTCSCYSSNFWLSRWDIGFYWFHRMQAIFIFSCYSFSFWSSRWDVGFIDVTECKRNRFLSWYILKIGLPDRTFWRLWEQNTSHINFNFFVVCKKIDMKIWIINFDCFSISVQLLFV